MATVGVGSGSSFSEKRLPTISAQTMNIAVAMFLAIDSIIFLSVKLVSDGFGVRFSIWLFGGCMSGNFI